MAQAADLASLAARLARKNPAVQAAQSSYTAELESARAANVLEGPELEGDFKVASDGSGENRWGVSIGQSFDWPGVYSARAKANGYRAEAFQYLYRSQLADAAYDAHITLIDLSAAAEVADIMRRAADNIDRMHDAIEYAYTRGDVTALDLKKIHIERFSMHSRLAKAEAALQGFRATVRALNDGNDLDITASLPATVEPAPLADYQHDFDAANPATAAARSMARALDADIAVAKRSGLPSFKIAYSHEYEERTHFNGVSIGISLPTWSNKHNRRAAEAAARAAALDNTDYTLRLGAELSANYATARSLADRLAKAKCAFDGEDYGDLLKKALDMGAITVLEYLTEYNAYLDAAAEFVELKAEMARAMAFLNKYRVE